MDGNLASTLDTTNLMLGIMAAVSVLEALVLIGVAVGAFMAYRKVTTLIADLEARQIAPLREKVDGILADVKSVTARVSHQTERVDHAIAGTMDRVDDTAERVRSTVREKVHQATGVVRGVRAVITSLFGSDSRPKPPATAAGRL
jgi:hypothetical protein